MNNTQDTQNRKKHKPLATAIWVFCVVLNIALFIGLMATAFIDVEFSEFVQIFHNYITVCRWAIIAQMPLLLFMAYYDAS